MCCKYTLLVVIIGRMIKFPPEHVGLPAAEDWKDVVSNYIVSYKFERCFILYIIIYILFIWSTCLSDLYICS